MHRVILFSIVAALPVTLNTGERSYRKKEEEKPESKSCENKPPVRMKTIIFSSFGGSPGKLTETLLLPVNQACLPARKKLKNIEE